MKCDFGNRRTHAMKMLDKSAVLPDGIDRETAVLLLKLFSEISEVAVITRHEKCDRHTMDWSEQYEMV